MANIGDSRTGTEPGYSSPAVHGTRRVTYAKEEHLAVIERDTFEKIETTIKDRQLFLTVAAVCLGLSAPIFERGVEYYITDDSVSGILLGIFVSVFLTGCLFLCLYWQKNKDYKKSVNNLYKRNKIISDVTEIMARDGTSVMVNNLNSQQGGSDVAGKTPVT